MRIGLAEIGHRCEQRRKDKGWTQSEAALRSNVNRTTISKIENGHFSGSLNILITYLTVLGLQLAVKSVKTPVFGDANEDIGDD
jgi:transcriptional regulator with XRE-family HTH domain